MGVKQTCDPKIFSVPVLFSFTPTAYLSVWIKLYVNEVGIAADWTILDVTLIRSAGDVNGNDDFLATGITDVASFVVHARHSNTSLQLRQ